MVQGTPAATSRMPASQIASVAAASGSRSVNFWERAGLPSLAVVGLVSAVTAKRPNSNASRSERPSSRLDHTASPNSRAASSSTRLAQQKTGHATRACSSLARFAEWHELRTARSSEAGAANTTGSCVTTSGALPRTKTVLPRRIWHARCSWVQSRRRPESLSALGFSCTST